MLARSLALGIISTMLQSVSEPGGASAPASALPSLLPSFIHSSANHHQHSNQQALLLSIPLSALCNVVLASDVAAACHVIITRTEADEATPVYAASAPLCLGL